MRRHVATLLAATSLVVALTACTAPANPADDGVLRIVASTNVYGDLSSTIAGPDAVVTSIIDDPSADPHGFEANPRVQLALAEADLVIANGGGYDDFVDEMLKASGNTTALVLHAVDYAAVDPEAEGFNEHVWYSYDAMLELTAAIGEALDGISAEPARAERIADLQSAIADLSEQAAEIARDHAGEGVVVTEPVPLYLLEAAGLVNLTPSDFTEAIEEDTDVAPALLHEVLNAVSDASVVVVNSQTGGPQTDAVLASAAENGVPYFAVTETLPAGLDYVDWQAGLLVLLRDSLTR